MKKKKLWKIVLKYGINEKKSDLKRFLNFHSKIKKQIRDQGDVIVNLK